MLQITRETADTFVLVSDDAHAENVALTEAITECAPELLDRWSDTPVGDDGLLRFSVERADWEGLREVLEELSCGMIVDPEELAAIEAVVNLAIEE